MSGKIRFKDLPLTVDVVDKSNQLREVVQKLQGILECGDIQVTVEPYRVDNTDART